MTELQRWFLYHIAQYPALQSVYAEHLNYMDYFPAQAAGLWRIH